MNDTFRRCGVAAALCAFVISTLPLPAAAKTVRIGANSGGHIGDFMMRLASYRQSGAQVQFTSTCDSACTLLLALPRNQSCITSGAVFRFHAPTARSAGTGAAAKRFMMSNYPVWVRSWIASHNGLTRQLISMNYSYARKFMRSCDDVIAMR